MNLQASVPDQQTQRDIDAILDSAFGPSDPATDALIAASVVAHQLPPGALPLLVGIAEYGRRRAARG